MFCYQCEQTASGTGCTAVGVCGKKPEAAQAMDELTGALIGLARAAQGKTPIPDVTALVMEGLFATLTNVNFDPTRLAELTRRVRAAKERLGGAADYAPQALFHGETDTTSLRATLLFGLRGMAAYAWHAHVLGQEDPEVTAWLLTGLRAAGETHGVPEWLALLLELGRVNLRCLALLDAANTEAFGHPVPTRVSTRVARGPFIVVTGHDLHDLKELLVQTQGKGVNIYTHGEMLPAHAYPGLKQYPHLKGHYGTAWPNQQQEFAGLPAPILFTTNCLMPPKDSYADRVFTTAMVGYPGVSHIAEKNGRKDFSPLINKALALGGFREERAFPGRDGGTELVTGYGRQTVLGAAGTVVEAVKGRAIKHFFLVGGCDGAKTARSYYTEFVKQTPRDTVVLTLGCGKFRFNDLALGEIGGLPRLLDMGQCNDAYGAVQVASALAGAFHCGVNDLPLTLVLSWYEQKAVVILLSLLALGVKNIYIGPSLPAFLSPSVAGVLVKEFGLKPVSTPEADLTAMLS